MSTPAYSVSQELAIRQPKKQDSYPIPCQEWQLLKSNISKLTVEPWLMQNVGFLLWGAGLSTIITIVLGNYSGTDQKISLVIAWAVVAVALSCGSACLYFASSQRAMFKERAESVVAQMSLIEQRYEADQPDR